MALHAKCRLGLAENTWMCHQGLFEGDSLGASGHAVLHEGGVDRCSCQRTAGSSLATGTFRPAQEHTNTQQPSLRFEARWFRHSQGCSD